MGTFEFKGSSPLWSKFTISQPFFTVNVVGGGWGAEGREIKVNLFVRGTCGSKRGHFFFAFGPFNQKLFEFDREKR
jgi:hypothetical protein